jgi:hypothetical protein
MGEWSESRHLERYLALIARARASRPSRPLYRPALVWGDRRSQRVPGGASAD